MPSLSLAVLIGAMAFAASLLRGGLTLFAVQPLVRCFEGIDWRELPRSGDVTFVYHTYRGCLLWVVEDEHCVAARPEDAYELLGRLLRFNLTWGLLSRYLILAPVAAVSNYSEEWHSLRDQTANLAEDGAA